MVDGKKKPKIEETGLFKASLQLNPTKLCQNGFVEKIRPLWIGTGDLWDAMQDALGPPQTKADLVSLTGLIRKRY